MRHNRFVFKICDFYNDENYHYVEYKGDIYPFYLNNKFICVPFIPPFSVRETIERFFEYLAGKNYDFDHIKSSELRYSDLFDKKNDYKFKVHIYNYKTLNYDIYGINDL